MVQAVNKHGEGPLSDLVVGQTKEAGEGGGERGSGHSQTLLINFPGVAGLSDQQFLHNYSKNFLSDLGWIILLVVFSTKHHRKILVNLFLSSALLVSAGGWDEIWGYKSPP